MRENKAEKLTNICFQAWTCPSVSFTVMASQKQALEGKYLSAAETRMPSICNLLKVAIGVSQSC